MEVKIYREPENESLIINDSELKEYNSLVNKLNLTNEIVEHVPSIYTPINQSMSKLLTALCPSKVNLDKYNKSTIPLEVLKVVDFAIKNKMFEGFYVWYADKDPDPLLIGWNWQNAEAKKNKYTWQKDESLIARWGDCSMEIDELLKKGFQSLKVSLIDSAKKVINYSEGVLKNPDTYVREHLKSNLNFPTLDIRGSSDLGDLPF